MTSDVTTRRVCLDANILLELLFKRVRYEAVVAALEAFTNAQFCMTVLSVDLVMYFVESEKQSKLAARQFLSNYEPLSLLADDIEWAFDHDQGDYEDALQVACARRHGCDLFITLDGKLASMYSEFLPVQTIR